ncbi:DUF6705 family protein [uncultured Bacteroides sp.]|uniref:DUF6705 family protein n=1 Tax=uncultured Bacteroides sp. TaxID=162156 RepID=UPI002624312C|nr:DUF6705 family protein [uncultured Bacteroides sp.]
MKKLFLFLVALCACVSINAQISVVDFMGTWRGEKSDTTFTIKLVQGETLDNGYTVKIFGGYSVSVKGQYSDDYLKINNQISNIYISGSYFPTIPRSIGATFYDQRKKHFDGNGIPACRIEYISKNKIRWTLNENLGIWLRIEGDEDAEEVQPIGFSVPTDIIMTRVE